MRAYRDSRLGLASVPYYASISNVPVGQTRGAFSMVQFGRVPRPVSRVSSSGFSLVAALFLIVVVAVLGAFAVRIGLGQQQTVNLALLSARALAAANSGIEYGAYQALSASVCANATLNLTEAGLNGFTVNVTCASTAHAESDGSVNVYRIESLATYGTYGQPDYVSRRVYATFVDQP